MNKVVVFLFWACVGFSAPSEVTFFLNANHVRNAQVLLRDDQYQVLYMTNQAPTFWTCPPNAECVNVPQECK